MSLKSIYTASRSAGLLPYVLGALFIAALLASAGGAWVGYRWHKGSVAIKDNKQLREDVEAWKAIAEQQYQRNVDSTLAMRAATGRMAAIAQHREQDRAYITSYFETQSTALRALLDARPDLQRDLGDDVLCHINRAKAGTRTDVPATIPGCKPGAAVPGAAVPDRQQSGGHSGRLGSDIEALRGLPQWQQPFDRGSQGVGSHRLAVVLRRGEARGPEIRGLSGREVK